MCIRDRTRRNSLLSKASGVARDQLRRRELLQPPVVLGPYEVEGAAVQPGDDQRAVVELAVHVGRRESGGTAPDGESRCAQVLRLDRQEPVDDLADTIG